MISRVRDLLIHLLPAREAHAPTGDQARKGFGAWLSPPDPTINFNTARETYHNGTATWFTRGEIFEKWKESGSENFLWIHGKRRFLILFASWLLLILPIWIGSGIWEKYLKVCRYPTRYIHDNSDIRQVRQSSTTRSVFPAPEYHV